MECMAVTVWMTYMAQKGSMPDMVWVAEMLWMAATAPLV